MKIKTVKVGYLETNCYIIEKNNSCLIIDPGDDFQKIYQNISLDVKGILITHHHFDHIGALKSLQNHFKIQIYDIHNLKEELNIIDVFSFHVIYNPGHTADSISFLFKDNLFCGDFIFKNAIGRTDLPSGNSNEMQKSIKKVLTTFPKDLNIYPGHGEKTTLKDEIKNLKSYL